MERGSNTSSSEAIAPVVDGWMCFGEEGVK
jgi:hypothetical protein